MSKTERRGKHERDHQHDKVVCAPTRKAFKMTDAKKRGKDVYVGKMLRITKRVGKLSHAMADRSSTFGKVMFDSAQDLVNDALRYGASLLVVSCHLAYTEQASSDPKKIAEFDAVLKQFTDAETKAMRALEFARQHAKRTNPHV
jgi:hypothetical protein